MNAKKLLTRFKSSGNKYISLIGLLILATIIIWCFDDIAIYLYGQASDSKGKFLSILVTIIGGLAVFYGLYLNSKRIKEQTRQNDLSDKSNNDKRFGEAIGYLNSDNVGIAIGGVYTLNQLALEDERYRAIVCDIFCEYLSRMTKMNYERTSYQVNETIINLLFNSSNSIVDFIEEGIIVKDAYFVNVTIENTKGAKFIRVVFEECHITIDGLTIIENSTILSSYIYLNGHIAISSSHSEDSVIESLRDNDSRITIEDSELNNIKILAEYEIKKILMCNNQINGVFLASGFCINGGLLLKSGSKMKIQSPDTSGLSISGNTKFVEIDNSQPYD